MPPPKKQHLNYSGKKKSHTAKVQTITTQDGEILSADCTVAGRTHDFALFKSSRRNLSRAGCILADSGYQGIAKHYPQAKTPVKASKNHKLTTDEKRHNRELSSQRIVIENIFAKLKTFKVLSCRYRNHLKRLGLRFNLIAGIVNYERNG